MGVGQEMAELQTHPWARPLYPCCPQTLAFGPELTEAGCARSEQPQACPGVGTQLLTERTRVGDQLRVLS